VRSIQKVCIAWLVVFASILLYSSLAKSEVQPPEPVQGTFVFVDHFEPVMTIDVRRVYGFTEAARLKLRQLKDNGYSCKTTPRQTYRCVKHSELNEIGEELQRRVFAKIEQHLWFDFLDVKGGTELLVDGETYKSWRVSRGVSTALGLYRSYEITWTPEISKVVLRDEKSDLPTIYLNFDALNSFNFQTTVSKTFDRDHFQIYVVRAIYERGCFVGGSTRPAHRCGDRDR
jgi:hypothetical protein